MQYLAWRLTTAAAERLPPRVSNALAAGAGITAYYAWRKGRRAAERNFRRVLGADSARARDAQRLARRSFVHYCQYLAEFARLPSLSAAERRAALVDEEPLQRLLETPRPRGVVIALPHLGNWDLAAAAVAARGLSLAVVGERFGDARLDRLVFGQRERLGIRVVPLGTPAPSLLRTLRDGGAVALLIDRPLRRGGAPVRFFGAETRVPDGPARLALRTGAAVVAAAAPRVGPGRVRLLAEFGLEQEAGSPASLTQRIMDACERFVSAYPDQWYMFRDFWPVE